MLLRNEQLGEHIFLLGVRPWFSDLGRPSKTPPAKNQSGKITMSLASIGTRILVTGAGGFIGHHLTKYLTEQGSWVRGVDIKYPAYERTSAEEFEIVDLRQRADCLQATRNVDQVYNLAANIGGIGIIEANKAVIVHDNTLINMNMLEAARLNGIKTTYIHLRLRISRLSAEESRRRSAKGV
jgi:FlaA1/EpsC-like NDP-sugar epimerase